MIRAFVGYLGVGAMAALVNIGARAVFSTVAPFELAVVLAFPVALTCAFLLNRAYVFESGSEAPARQYAKFALVNLCALALVWAVSVGLYRVVFPEIGFDWHADLIAHAAGVASPVLLTFLAYRYFVFAGLRR